MYNPIHIAGGNRHRRRHRVGLEINDPRRQPPSGGGTGNPGGLTQPVRDWPSYVPTGGGGGNPSYVPPGGGNGNPGWVPPPVIITDPRMPTPPSPTYPGPTTPTGCAPACQVCPENQKRYPLPFVPDAGYTASVTAGSTVRFVGRPQKLFKPDRLIIASSIAPYFDIVSLTIGNIPQSLASGNVSSEMFSEVATYVMMTFDQAYPGIEIILTAQNKSSVTQTFQAQLVGEAVG